MLPTIAIALLCCAPFQDAPAAETSAAASSEPPPPVPVLRGEMGIRMKRSGRVESTQSEPVAWDPEAFRGEVVVSQVLKRIGAVTEGDVVLILESTDGELDRQIEDAQRGADFAQQRQDLQAREQAMQAERMAKNLERTQHALEIALRSLARWEEYGKAKSFEMSQLSTQGAVDGLADQAEELSQLEKLYEGATLDGQTRDIVLERARRSLKRSDRYTHYNIADGDYFRAVEFAEQDRKVRESAVDAEVDARHASEGQAIAVARAAMAAVDAAEQTENSQRQLAKLLADREGLQIRALQSGLMGPISLEEHDKVVAGAPLASIVNPRALQVKIALPADMTRVAGAGTPVAVHFGDLPACDCAGTITQVSPFGRAEGEGTVFDAIVTLNAGAQPPPPGLSSSVEIKGELRDVLQVNKKALSKNADGDQVVRVQRGETTVEVAVVTGLSQGEMIEIVSGLAPGDLVHAGGQ